MRLSFFKQRTVWWPTWLGWCTIAALFFGPVLLWWFQAETFLGRTERVPASILVVEGWIGPPGISAAKREFLSHGYDIIITTSGLSGEIWTIGRWNFALEAEKQLIGSGIPRAKVLAAVPVNDDNHRTFHSAAAVARMLEAEGLRPTAINVFTRGVHARRSRLVFAKVFGSDVRVGVIAWEPTNPNLEPWWHSSPRANDLLKETAGYLYELLLNSGRATNEKTRPQTGDKR